MISNNENPIIDELAQIFSNTKVSLKQHAIIKDMYVIHLEENLKGSFIKELQKNHFVITTIKPFDTKSIKIFVYLRNDD